MSKHVRHVNKKVQLDATICRHLFTAKSLYMFRASQHPSSGAYLIQDATEAVHVSLTTNKIFQWKYSMVYSSHRTRE